MATLRPRLSVIVLGVVAVLLLATAGTRATLDSRRLCRGTIDAESLWEKDPTNSLKRGEAIKRAQALTARITPMLAHSIQRPGWDGTFEREWRMGDLVAYERGASSYPSTVSIGLVNGCDDRTVLHDGYHSGTLEARRDLDTGIWYASTMSGGAVSFATPIRIVEKPGATRFTPRASFFFFVGGSLLFALALLLFARGRRYAALQRLEEAIVVGKDGRATTTEGKTLALVPPPALGAVVLVVDARAEGTQADPYRASPERTTASWLPWTRDRARRRETRALTFAAALYVAGVVLGLASFMQT